VKARGRWVIARPGAVLGGLYGVGALRAKIATQLRLAAVSRLINYRAGVGMNFRLAEKGLSAARQSRR